MSDLNDRGHPVGTMPTLWQVPAAAHRRAKNYYKLAGGIADIQDADTGTPCTLTRDLKRSPAEVKADTRPYRRNDANLDRLRKTIREADHG